jgi:hypothetical protein
LELWSQLIFIYATGVVGRGILLVKGGGNEGGDQSLIGRRRPSPSRPSLKSEINARGRRIRVIVLQTGLVKTGRAILKKYWHLQYLILNLGPR